MAVAVIVILVLVQAIQLAGNKLSARMLASR